jgi:hypothetical protein
MRITLKLYTKVHNELNSVKFKVNLHYAFLVCTSQRTNLCHLERSICKCTLLKWW